MLLTIKCYMHFFLKRLKWNILFNQNVLPSTRSTRKELRVTKYIQNREKGKINNEKQQKKQH